MSDSSDSGPVLLRGLPPGIWVALAAVIVAVAIALHGLFPRYELSTVGQDGRSVIVFDRWTGEFQRADYSPQGEPTLTSVVRPF